VRGFRVGENFGGGEGGERVWLESGSPSEKLGIGKQSHEIGIGIGI